MVQAMVQIVERLARAVSRIQWEMLIVRRVEFGPESAEKLGKSQIRFPVAVVAARIEYEWLAARIEGRVSRPQIAMQQGWLRLVV